MWTATLVHYEQTVRTPCRAQPSSSAASRSTGPSSPITCDSNLTPCFRHFGASQEGHSGNNESTDVVEWTTHFIWDPREGTCAYDGPEHCVGRHHSATAVPEVVLVGAPMRCSCLGVRRWREYVLDVLRGARGVSVAHAGHGLIHDDGGNAQCARALWRGSPSTVSRSALPLQPSLRKSDTPHRICAGCIPEF